MEVRNVNRARGLGVGQLSARYRRLRFADDVALRIAELDEELELGEYDDEDRWYYREPDPRAEDLDGLVPELRRRIRVAAPFNPLDVVGSFGGREPGSRTGSAEGKPAIEQRLVEHYDRSSTRSLDAWLVGEEVEDDLARLEVIADERLGGSLDPLVGLVLFRPFWIRPLASWRAPTRG